MSVEITQNLVDHLLDVVDKGLTRGLGNNKPGMFCVEAAVCYVLGEGFHDSPSCVNFAIRSIKISLNDSRWSNKKVRADGMRRLAVAQLGSIDVDVELWQKLVLDKSGNYITIYHLLNDMARSGMNPHKRDRNLATIAEWMVEACIKCRTEGSKFLDSIPISELVWKEGEKR